MSETPSKSDSAADAKIDADYCEGEMTIISSDGWTFRVPSARVFAQCTVLRDAASMDPTDDGSFKLELAGAKTETADAIRPFLHWVIRGELPHVHAGLEQVQNLVTLAQKWDCKSLLSALPYFIQALMARPSDSKACCDPSIAFAIGCQLDSPETCAAALDRESEWSWENDVARHEADAECSLLDPRAMPLAYFADIPPPYMYTLVRTFERGHSRLWAKFVAVFDSTK